MMFVITQKYSQIIKDKDLISCKAEQLITLNKLKAVALN